MILVISIMYPVFAAERSYNGSSGKPGTHPLSKRKTESRCRLDLQVDIHLLSKKIVLCCGVIFGNDCVLCSVGRGRGGGLQVVYSELWGRGCVCCGRETLHAHNLREGEAIVFCGRFYLSGHEQHLS